MAIAFRGNRLSIPLATLSACTRRTSIQVEGAYTAQQRERRLASAIAHAGEKVCGILDRDALLVHDLFQGRVHGLPKGSQIMP